MLGASLAEWLRVVDLESLAPHCCWFESGQGLWIIVSCEGA